MNRLVITVVISAAIVWIVFLVFSGTIPSPLAHIHYLTYRMGYHSRIADNAIME